MKDLTTAEAYFLCAVQGKGKIFGHDDNKIACLLAAVFQEMKESGLIELAETTLAVTRQNKFPTDCSPYLLPVYEHLKELESLELKHIMQDYNSGWSDRRLNALTTAIGNGLADRGFATRAKLGLFNGRVYFMPCKAVIPALAAELLVNILYHSPVPAGDGFLWLLLGKSACTPKELSEEQQHNMNDKIASAIESAEVPELAGLDAFADRLLSMVKHYPI